MNPHPNKSLKPEERPDPKYLNNIFNYLIYRYDCDLPMEIMGVKEAQVLNRIRTSLNN